MDESPDPSALIERHLSDPRIGYNRAGGQEPVDSVPVCTDHPAHRATRVAPDVIPNTGQGAGAMSSGGRRGGGVSERDRRRDQTRKHWVAQAPGFTRRTPIDLSGGLNELDPG